MYLSLLTELVAAEQRQDQLREAELARLIHLVQSQSEKTDWRQTTMNQVGVQLVKWGLKLQGDNVTTLVQASADSR